jgi:hypothetical protein
MGQLIRKLPFAVMAEQADARDLKSLDRKIMSVRARLTAPQNTQAKPFACFVEEAFHKPRLRMYFDIQ